MNVVMQSSLCGVALLLLLPPAEANGIRDSARTFLASSFGVSSQEIETIDDGRVMARTLAARDPREVATLGVVRVQVTPEFYVEQLADIVRFKRTEAVLEIGRFGNPPDLRDVADLTLDDADIGRLRDCQIGDCGIQLSAEAIAQFRKAVDWRRPDVASQASRLMGQILVEYVTNYRNAGTPVSMEYADGSDRVNTSREFASLVDGDHATWQQFADLRRHLLQYPSAPSPQTNDILYWSKERASRRTIVSVTHLAISRTTRGPTDYAIASKQLYASRYFDASLGLTLLLPDPSATSSPATYLVYLNRSRVDLFDGMFGGLARRMVSTRVRSIVTQQLERLQQSMERQFRASSSASAGVPTESTAGTPR
jgi:hypothetical protein